MQQTNEWTINHHRRHHHHHSHHHAHRRHRCHRHHPTLVVTSHSSEKCGIASLLSLCFSGLPQVGRKVPKPQLWSWDRNRRNLPAKGGYIQRCARRRVHAVCFNGRVLLVNNSVHLIKSVLFCYACALSEENLRKHDTFCEEKCFVTRAHIKRQNNANLTFLAACLTALLPGLRGRVRSLIHHRARRGSLLDYV